MFKKNLILYLLLIITGITGLQLSASAPASPKTVVTYFTRGGIKNAHGLEEIQDVPTTPYDALQYYKKGFTIIIAVNGINHCTIYHHPNLIIPDQAGKQSTQIIAALIEQIKNTLKPMHLEEIAQKQAALKKDMADIDVLAAEAAASWARKKKLKQEEHDSLDNEKN